MNNITMIKVEQLYHHPENPRKDLGDISELTESIRKNGIMQNLTVVPGHRMTKEEWVAEARAEGADKVSAEGSYNPEDAEVSTGYTVVIGNRRMEAAKAAGLEEVPCVISDMDHKEQIATMLEENMQRADLTVYEQAQGFQMMMDLGYSAQEISEKTGFSETTVGRRLKMAQLDKETFRDAVGKQITIDDLDKIGKIESIEKRNELLKEYGSNNFDWQVTRAIREQQADKVWPAAQRMIENHEPMLKQIPESERTKLYYGSWKKLYNQELELDKWDGKHNFIPDTEDQLYWMKNGLDIEFYIKEKKEKKQEKKTPEQIEKEKRIALAWKTAERANGTATELRREFVKGLKVTPKNAMEMMQWALIAAVSCMITYQTPTQRLRKEIPIKSYNIHEELQEIRDWLMETSQHRWPELILKFFEGETAPEKIGYVSGGSYEMPKHQEHKKLDLCYEWLTQFGYRMSDEEIRLMSGEHECFGKDGAAE